MRCVVGRFCRHHRQAAFYVNLTRIFGTAIPKAGKTWRTLRRSTMVTGVFEVSLRCLRQQRGGLSIDIGCPYADDANPDPIDGGLIDDIDLGLVKAPVWSGLGPGGLTDD